jgi:nicotinate-nucleotide adenylyltransferase
VVADAAAPTVALFGGSFNPPHVSHLLAATWALSAVPVDKVLVVPVFKHPFSKELAPFDDRLQMCRLALGWVPGVEVSDVERRLGGESLTLRTVEHLAEAEPTWRLRLLIGADVLADLPKWHRFDRIRELAPPIVLGRAGVDDARAPAAFLPQVSSTEVRAALGKGDVEAVRGRVPAAVIDYAVRRGLYGARA